MEIRSLLQKYAVFLLAFGSAMAIVSINTIRIYVVTGIMPYHAKPIVAYLLFVAAFGMCGNAVTQYALQKLHNASKPE